MRACVCIQHQGSQSCIYIFKESIATILLVSLIYDLAHSPIQFNAPSVITDGNSFVSMFNVHDCTID